MKLLASEIALFLGKKLLGKDLLITRLVPISSLTRNCLSFASEFHQEYVEIINRHPASLIICSEDYQQKLQSSYIISTNPRLDFLRTVGKFIKPSQQISIHPSAIISDQSKIGKGVGLGSHTFIGPNVEIGDNTVIQHNVVILGPVKIGKNCYIKSGAVIGEEGFGFEYDESGIPQHFPHIGSIEIGNNVWLGACSTIERGTLAKTAIEDNVKIDDLVQIGHNSLVGQNTLIMAGTVICGGAVIGKNCWIAPNSTVKEKIKIGDHAFLGLGCVVIEDVSPETVVVGNPAKKLRHI